MSEHVVLPVPMPTCPECGEPVQAMLCQAEPHTDAAVEAIQAVLIAAHRKLVHEPTKRAVDVVADALGYDRPRNGLLGSGLSKMLAYQRAGDVLKALGLPLDVAADAVRRWGAGEDVAS